MRPFRWLARAATQASVGLGVVCLAAGPEAVRGRIDEAVVASWRAAGEALAHRDLAAMARGLDRTRVELRRARDRRDALARRLCDLEARRQAAGTRAERDRGLLRRITALLDRLPDGEDRAALRREASWSVRRGLDADREIAELSAAALLLSEEIARADRRIRATRDHVIAGESRLAVLRATDATRRLRRQLAGLDDAPPPWEACAGRVTEILRPFDPAPATELGTTAIGRFATLSRSSDPEGRRRPRAGVTQGTDSVR
jgi:hypothetical protein